MKMLGDEDGEEASRPATPVSPVLSAAPVPAPAPVVERRRPKTLAKRMAMDVDL